MAKDNLQLILRQEMEQVMNDPQKQRELLTRRHPYWRGFMSRLNQNLREHGCVHDLTSTRRILNSLPNIDEEATIQYFASKGGHCDCKVLYHLS
jgi:hypothetical protein